MSNSFVPTHTSIPSPPRTSILFPPLRTVPKSKSVETSIQRNQARRRLLSHKSPPPPAAAHRYCDFPISSTDLFRLPSLQPIPPPSTPSSLVSYSPLKSPTTGPRL